ncbi:unnamed protein product, partial [Owenia fusiformis]
GNHTTTQCFADCTIRFDQHKFSNMLGPSIGCLLAVLTVYCLKVRGAVVKPSEQWEEGCGISKYPDAGNVPDVGGYVMGGVPSRRGEFPWQVMMAKSGRFLCGGFLITNQWVVSAMHCLSNPADTHEDYELWVGKHTWNDQNDGVMLKPTIIVKHPDYDSQTYEADIMMFKLPYALNYTDDIRPVCMPEVGNLYVGQQSIVAGWGTFCSDCSYPDNIHHVNLPIISNNDCVFMLLENGRSDIIFDSNICHETPMKDTGYGDSGGAFLHKGANGIFRAIGVVSWGYDPAGDPALPGIGQRVTSFVPWINAVMLNN